MPLAEVATVRGLPSGTHFSAFTLQTTHALFLPARLELWGGWLWGGGRKYHLALILGLTIQTEDE